jgi:hypothetical protein
MLSRGRDNEPTAELVAGVRFIRERLAYLINLANAQHDADAELGLRHLDQCCFDLLEDLQR